MKCSFVAYGSLEGYLLPMVVQAVHWASLRVHCSHQSLCQWTPTVLGGTSFHVSPVPSTYWLLRNVWMKEYLRKKCNNKLVPSEISNSQRWDENSARFWSNKMKTMLLQVHMMEGTSKPTWNVLFPYNNSNNKNYLSSCEWVKSVVPRSRSHFSNTTDCMTVPCLTLVDIARHVCEDRSRC